MFLAFLSGSSGRLTGVYAGGGNKNPKAADKRISVESKATS
jgi:hypothetical protein